MAGGTRHRQEASRRIDPDSDRHRGITRPRVAWKQLGLPGIMRGEARARQNARHQPPLMNQSLSDEREPHDPLLLHLKFHSLSTARRTQENDNG